MSLPESPPSHATADASAAKVTPEPGPEAVQGTTVRAARWRLIHVVIGLLLVSGLFYYRGVWWPPGFRALARVAVQHREPGRALEWLDFATAFAPEDAETALLRARAYRHQGNMTAVEQALQRARKLAAPADRLQLEVWLSLAQSGQLRAVESHLPRLLTVPGNDGPEICEAFVIGYLRSQRTNQALQLLKAWMGDWPEQARPYVLRGRIYSTNAQFLRAADDFRRAIELDPTNIEATAELAFALQRDNHPVEAIPYFEKCLRDRVWGPRAKLGLASCLKATGQLDRAQDLLAQAVAAEPKDYEALREFGRLELENGNFQAAVDLLERARKLVPYEDEVRYLLAQALQSLGRTTEAKPHFDYVGRARQAFKELNVLQDELRSYPNDLDRMARAGELLLEFSDPQEGVVRLQAVVDQDPRHQQARRLLANHYQQRAAERPEFQRLADEQRRWLNAAEPDQP